MGVKAQTRKEKSLPGIVLLPTAIDCFQAHLIRIETFGLEGGFLLIGLLHVSRAS